jgi:hypothetical protein
VGGPNSPSPVSISVSRSHHERREGVLECILRQEGFSRCRRHLGQVGVSDETLQRARSKSVVDGRYLEVADPKAVEARRLP